MSNVYKSMLMFHDTEEEILMIDSNERMDARMEEQQKIEEEKRQRELEQKKQEAIAAAMENGELEEGQDLEGILTDLEEATALQEPNEEMLEMARQEAEEILNDARNQAQEILEKASAQADVMKRQSIEEGKKEGYDAGKGMAIGEMAQMEKELQEKEEEMRRDYLQKQEEIERELVDVICDIVGKVFKVQFSDKNEILIHLVENAIMNIESSKEFQVKVNDSSYEFLQNNKVQIQDLIGSDIQLDIILDPILDDGQCIIETDGGVFDCSMGVQLDNLMKDIKSLSI